MRDLLIVILFFTIYSGCICSNDILGDNNPSVGTRNLDSGVVNTPDTGGWGDINICKTCDENHDGCYPDNDRCLQSSQGRKPPTDCRYQCRAICPKSMGLFQLYCNDCNKSDCWQLMDTEINSNYSSCFKCYSSDFFPTTTLPSYLREKISNCENIQTEDLKADCILKISESDEHGGVCDYIVDMTKRDRCYYNIGVRDQEMRLPSGRRYQMNYVECEKIESQELKDECLKKVGVMRWNVMVCDKVVNETIKNTCYDEVAYYRRNTSICNKINVLENRDKCYSTVIAML